MDEIRIENLEIYAYHGVFPEEKEKGQTFYVNCTLFLDLRKAGLTDDLEETVDYGRVCQVIREIMQGAKHDLIEKVAEEIAADLLRFFPKVWEVDLEIRKPDAPIGIPLESVSVKIHRGWHRVYLSIGSNMGDREGYLKMAVEKLRNEYPVRNVRMSSILETKPYGGVEQDDFLNAAIALETTESPAELLRDLHEIEQAANRKREIHWGPRTLDLDVIFYDKLIFEDDDLIIPHVDAANREFVLKPLCELAPNYRHPILKKTIRQLLEELQGKAASEA